MKAEKFYSLEVPAPRVVLGLRLRPLSLGHVVLLNRIESVFLLGGKPDFSELAIATAIIASTFEQGCAILDDPETPAAMGRWAQKLTKTRLIDRILGRSPEPIEFQSKVDAIREHISEGNWCPGVHNTSDGQSIDLPLYQVVKVTIMRELHFSEAEVMDRSWSKCLTDFVTMRALDGHVELMEVDEVKAFVERAREVALKRTPNGNDN